MEEMEETRETEKEEEEEKGTKQNTSLSHDSAGARGIGKETARLIRGRRAARVCITCC
jgi:hypothetical protein